MTTPHSADALKHDDCQAEFEAWFAKRTDDDTHFYLIKRQAAIAAWQAAWNRRPTPAPAVAVESCIPPFAEPAGQLCANPAVITELRRWAGDDHGYAATLIRVALKEIEQLEASLAAGAAREGGITSAESSRPTPASPDPGEPFIDVGALRGKIASMDDNGFGSIRFTLDEARALLDRVERAEAGSKHYSMGADAEAKSADEWRERALRAESAAGAVPEGYVLVPKVPTREMVAAAQFNCEHDDDAERGDPKNYRAQGQCLAVYADMIAAAPKAAPSQQAEAAPETSSTYIHRCERCNGLGHVETDTPAAAPSEAKPVAWRDVLTLALEQLEDWEVQIDSEWGSGRQLKELERDNSLSKATVAVRAALATPPAQDAGTGEAASSSGAPMPPTRGTGSQRDADIGGTGE